MSATGLEERRVEPELLDALPPDDPRARRSRRDLVRVNALMGQSRILARLVLRHAEAPPRRILEIGAGDGTGALALARRLGKRWPGVEITLLDRAGALPPGRLEEIAAAGWRARVLTADVFTWAREAGEEEEFELGFAGLVLHHFSDRDLETLFRLLRPRVRILVAAETRRDRFSLAMSHMLWAVGASAVTRHDAPASVRAGFRGDELGRLWRGAGGGVLEEGRVGLFTHAMAGSAAP